MVYLNGYQYSYYSIFLLLLLLLLLFLLLFFLLFLKLHIFVGHIHIYDIITGSLL